jgi:hypothetical protein
VDTLDLDSNTVAAIVSHVQVRKVYQAIVDQIRARSTNLGLLLIFGPQTRALAQHLSLGSLPVVNLKAWAEPGSLPNWQSQLQAIQQLDYEREVADPGFTYDGQRGQIPRIDLPYGTLRWMGTSGHRARRPADAATGVLSPDYYKIFLPDWVYRLDPAPLSSEEQAAIANAPHS